MKKILLLSCALVCASQIYAMEPEQGNYIGELPPEDQFIIIRALSNTYNPKLKNIENLKNAINALNAMSRVNKRFNAIFNDLYSKSRENLKEFTKLVHILANNFNVSTKEVAQQFNTPIAQQYIDLGEQLIIAVLGEKLDPERKVKFYEKNGRLPVDADPKDIIELIESGADVNYIPKVDPKINYKESPLSAAVKTNNVPLTTLLLQHGANPALVADILEPSFISYDEKIIKLIENALKEQALKRQK